MNTRNNIATLTMVVLSLIMPTYLVAQEPSIKEKEGERKSSNEDATFFYNLSQFLIPEPTKNFTPPSINNPGPDTANFPNSPYTLPKGMFYLETTPFNLAGNSASNSRTFTTPSLLRYGLTDDVELRLFTNGLTIQNDNPTQTGFSPIVFDIKIHFWDENKDLFLPAVGLEVLLQTTFGSKFLNTGIQPSFSLLFSKELIWDTLLESSVGLQSTDIGFNSVGDSYELNVQGALTKKISERFAIFAQTFYNGSVDPRFANNIVAGGGAIYSLTETVSLWGSYNAGLVKGQPPYLTYLGMAFAF